MVRYFYAWTPLVIVGTAVLLAAPWLALIAVMILAVAALVALAALACAIVSVPYTLGRAIGHRLQHRRDARPRTAPVLSPAGHPNPHPLFDKGARVMTFDRGLGRVASRSPGEPVVHISLEGAKR
jgi:hypothetical protein